MPQDSGGPPLPAPICACRPPGQLHRHLVQECEIAGKFEVYKDKSGGFRFRLKASNGEVIASSPSYKSKASALGGVESVKKNAASDVVDLTEEPAGSITGIG
ncbi:YegP family protein [Arthrobacter sp. UYCu712]|uniref:YegP family protein n=1 Tax=Arthrobacter sp. UYCu712 TaxID=3156340 RepID=UPI003391B94E